MIAGGFASVACSRYAHGVPSRRRQGEATVDADKVTLVLPILGLYAEVYAKHREKTLGRRRQKEHVLGIDVANVRKHAKQAGMCGSVP